MSDKIIENNQVTIMGQVASTLNSATKYSEKDFTRWKSLLVKRLSNSETN